MGTPDAGDPFVGLTNIPETGDSPDELPERRPGFWIRFSHQRWAIAGLVFLLIVIVAAIFAPLVAPHAPDAQDINAINAGPSASHWLGTDDLGRDILSRLIWGARISLRVSFEIVALAAIVAIPLGLIAGFFRGAVDSVIMRTMDALFSFPPLVLALTVAALLGADINDAAIAIAIVFVPSFVRLLRGEVIAVREEAYIESARSLGATSNASSARHVVPNVASPIIIQLALALGFALLTEAGLSFLGVGEQPPTPSWGGMLQEGFQFINTAPWALVFPGLAIMLTVLAFNLVADGLRDSLGRERPRGSSPVSGERESRRGPMARVRGIGRSESTRPRPDPRRMAACSTSRTYGSIPQPWDLAAGPGGGQFLGAPGKDAGLGGRKRLRQDRLRPRRDGLAPGQGVAGNGLDPLRWAGAHRGQPVTVAPVAWQRDGHDLPGADDQPEPGVHGGNQIAEQVRAPKRSVGPTPGRSRSRCSTGSRSHKRRRVPRTTRTPSQAACASGS